MSKLFLKILSLFSILLFTATPLFAQKDYGSLGQKDLSSDHADFLNQAESTSSALEETVAEVKESIVEVEEPDMTDWQESSQFSEEAALEEEVSEAVEEKKGFSIFSRDKKKDRAEVVEEVEEVMVEKEEKSFSKDASSMSSQIEDIVRGYISRRYNNFKIGDRDNPSVAHNVRAVEYGKAKKINADRYEILVDVEYINTSEPDVVKFTVARMENGEFDIVENVFA